MKGILHLLLLPLLVGIAMTADAASRETFDILTFTAPPGWERVPLTGLVSFRTPASSQGFAQIFLFPGRIGAGTPRENFQSEWKRLVTAPFGAAIPSQLNVDQTPTGWTAVSGAADVARDGATFGVLLVTATGQGRIASVVVNLGGQAHLAEVEQFFRQLEFRAGASTAPPAGAADRPAQAAAEAPRAGLPSVVVPIPPASVDKGKLAGLFYRLKAIPGAGRMEAETWLFLPGNRVARVFPFGGGDSFDALARCLPDSCGNYQLDGGSLTVRWDNGRTDRWAFAVASEGITLDGTAFKPARPIAEAGMVGEWRDAGGGLANVYRFEGNGTFTFGSGRQGSAGRYRVKGSTLLLTFADGTESRRTLFVAGSGTPAELICVEGDIYKRK